MAKVIGPLFSLNVRGSFGNIVFTRRGVAYPKYGHADAKTSSQGDFRVALTVAQKCVKVCGPTTRQRLKAATLTTTWHGYLVKQLIGPQRATFTAYWERYEADPGVDRPGWEAAAVEAGLRPIDIPYASRADISPGAQLFILASTLDALGLFPEVERPNSNAGEWRERIVS